MSDIRARLADALYGQAATFDECSQHYLKGWAERSADVVLSLRGIAIVDPADITKVVRKPSIGVYYTPSYVAALERLLAAAAQAQEEQQ